MAIETKPLEWAIWSEPLERANFKVENSDIKKAITWYHEQTGYFPDAICLSRNIAELVNKYGSIPDEITVFTKGGCLSWEIWLSGRMDELPSLTPVDNSHQTHSPSVAKPTRQSLKGKSTGKGIMQHLDRREEAPKSKISGSSNYATLKGPGRPPKEGKVHRSTDYRRRRKVLQGTLKI